VKAAKDLAVLEASGLVSIAALQPELAYMFRHALLQDAAYGSLLKQERRELHRRVARALDELYPDRRDELAGVVALHLEQAGDAYPGVPLGPLSVGESGTLVSNLHEIESLPVVVRDAILAKSEGNPFFVEEMIRMLIEHGAIERQGDRWMATEGIARVEIPDSLQRLLLARIDRLPESSRRTLRVAAVIGRQFAVRVLEQLVTPAVRP